ncbi:ferric reductase-like transmembrane component/FAD binding protein [Ephemerocybe angulata]|uniref:Ferric reductase-like transmembrane component/FAD binding protein n=1 Tax=Ephemerocybe angulata TaxID=980116 RepID=A0A8H6HF11_9AGAR|nr:ferric reductase-like transmembrane component/FAD binding protein [Tulosesus angulatus]
MSSAGAPPVVPTHSSYAETDLKYQHKFTIAWASILGFFLLISFPRLYASTRSGIAFKGFFGISESWDAKQYHALSVSRKTARKGGRIEAILNKASSMLWWTLPGAGVNVGQLLFLGGYIALVVSCIVVDASLVKNANRAGRIALAQLPIVFLFATKNSALSLLLGPGNGYEKLNLVHKWAGRGIFLGCVIHGSLWIKNHLDTETPILGQDKETTGIAAFALLCIIVLTSVLPVRRWFYGAFYNLHIVTFVAFFITVCYHTPEAVPWIFPALAFYGLDILLRMLRLRIKDALLVPCDKQMTLIHVQDCTDGWTAGQHIRLRVFSSGRVLESHPFSLLTAPPETTCVTAFPQGVNLGVRVMGDWTKALNDYATQTVEVLRKQEDEACLDEKKQVAMTSVELAGASKRAAFNAPPPEVPVQVMIDGPYGGCSIDLGRYENVLLFAGGAGATFTLGLLDDIVGRCVKLGRRNGEVTKRIEFAWCIRSFGAIDWFAPALMDIATMAASASSDLSLHISVYVTCLCNPEAVPPIPNCDVTIVRPSIYRVLIDLVTPPTGLASSSYNDIQEIPRLPSETADNGRPVMVATQTSSATDGKDETEVDVVFDPSVRNRLPWIGLGGGLAVCASGPESLTREASNAVARLQLVSGVRDLGIVGLHTEVFAL